MRRIQREEYIAEERRELLRKKHEERIAERVSKGCDIVFDKRRIEELLKEEEERRSQAEQARFRLLEAERRASLINYQMDIQERNERLATIMEERYKEAMQNYEENSAQYENHLRMADLLLEQIDNSIVNEQLGHYDPYDTGSVLYSGF